MRTLSIWVGIYASSAGLASAQGAVGNGAEMASSRSETHLDRHNRRDDRRDFFAIVEITGEWKASIASRDGARERAADERLTAWVAGELDEANREVGQADRERDRSRRERNRSGREEAIESGPTDRHDLRDDRRDLRDDRRDLAVAAMDRNRIWAIATELKNVEPLFANGTATHEQYLRKRALLTELVQMARAELGQNRREMREDRRERREDRRERREDRRQRRRGMFR